jgi:catechol-2,3-dioxygenase
MKIRQLSLYCFDINSQKHFYNDVLGFSLIDDGHDSFTIEVGWSHLKFIKSTIECKYHYCFLIPSNKLEEALIWMQNRTEVLEIYPQRYIQFFESWNAYSFYFLDANGNVAEFIARKDLCNDSNDVFDIKDVLCVNEIGMPTSNIKRTSDLLEQKMNSTFWKGNTDSFGTNGNQEGLLLLPNYKTRTKWFPTDVSVEPSPFIAHIEINTIFYTLEFANSNITILKNTVNHND